MSDYLVWTTVMVAVLTLLSPKPQKTETGFNWVSKFAYAVFVTCIAWSPILGGQIATAAGLELSLVTAIGFAWVGLAAALPLSLLTARSFGAEQYERYWSYLLAFRQNTKLGIVIWMVAATVAAMVLGLVLILLPS